MKKMFLALAQYWPANNYETVGVSIHLNHESVQTFSKRRFAQLKNNNPHPSDGFGKAKLIEIDQDLFNKFLKRSRYIPVEEYNKLCDSGRIVKHDKYL